MCILVCFYETWFLLLAFSHVVTFMSCILRAIEVIFMSCIIRAFEVIFMNCIIWAFEVIFISFKSIFYSW